MNIIWIFILYTVCPKKGRNISYEWRNPQNRQTYWIWIWNKMEIPLIDMFFDSSKRQIQGRSPFISYGLKDFFIFRIFKPYSHTKTRQICGLQAWLWLFSSYSKFYIFESSESSKCQEPSHKKNMHI